MYVLDHFSFDVLVYAFVCFSQSGLQKVDDQLDRVIEQVCKDSDTPLPVSAEIDRSVNQLNNQSVGQSVSQPVNQSVSQSVSGTCLLSLMFTYVEEKNRSLCFCYHLL